MRFFLKFVLIIEYIYNKHYEIGQFHRKNSNQAKVNGMEEVLNAIKMCSNMKTVNTVLRYVQSSKHLAN